MSNTVTEQVISQVRARPVLWDKKDEMYGNIQAMDYAWIKMSSDLKRDKEFLKKRWRRVRDVFRIEIKKLKAPDSPTQPLINYYSGVWPHFESMLFLKDSLTKRTPRLFFPEENEGDVTADNSLVQDSSIALDSSLAQASSLAQDSLAQGTLYKEEAASPETVHLEETEDEELTEKPFYVSVENWSENSKGKESRGVKRKVSEDWGSEFDEDVNFAKSIVGYLRRLNPIRKLMVRNEIQSLLLRELLCDKCRCQGQQKACRCE